MRIKTTLLFLGLVIIVFGQDKIVKAQEKNPGFSVAPFFQDITITPKEAGTPFALEVINNSGQLAVFRLSVLDFGTLNESGGVAFLGAGSPEQKYSLASWVNLENDTLVIAPEEKKIIRGTIQNKESLSPGGHYGAVFFKTEGEKAKDPQEDKQDNVALDPSFAALLFVRKTGGEIYGLQLADENISTNLFIMPNVVRPRFQNTGNVHVVPRGIVEITDPLGKLVAKGIINSESGIILPETFRAFPTPLNKMGLAWLPGKYKISMAYRYDGQNDFFGRNKSFYLVPLPFLALLLALSGGVYLAWRFRSGQKPA